jgi:hypothetical protein
MPDICVVFSACGEAARSLEAYRSWQVALREISHETVWVQQGSTTLPEVDAEKRLLLPESVGMDFASNAALFGLCRSPYILQLEDDWAANTSASDPQVLPPPAGWLRWGMSALRQLKHVRSVTYHSMMCGPFHLQLNDTSIWRKDYKELAIPWRKALSRGTAWEVDRSASIRVVARRLTKPHHNGPLLFRAADLARWGPRPETRPDSGIDSEVAYQRAVSSNDNLSTVGRRYMVFLESHSVAGRPSAFQSSCEQTIHLGGRRKPFAHSPCRNTSRYPRRYPTQNMTWPSESTPHIYSPPQE